MDDDKIKQIDAFRDGSSAAVNKILAEVEREGRRRVENGLNETNFTLGVLNSVLIVYIFGAFPQHFWLLYIIEAFVLIPVKYNEMRNQKPLSGALFVLDFCWCMNFIGVFALILFSLTAPLGSSIPEQFHKNLFLASFGVACGPLLGAAAILPFVALVFHNFGTMCDLFIHIYPPMLMYTLRWESDKILQAWPRTFDLDYDVQFFPSGENATFLGTIFGNTLFLYFFWLVPYLYWIVTIGMDLPTFKEDGKAPIYDTVFHANMRKGLCILLGNVLWKRPVEESKAQVATNRFETRDLYAYMFFHAVGVLLSILCGAYPCYRSKFLHGSLLTLLAVVCIWRGALRYTYYSTELYGKIVLKTAKNLDQNDKGSRFADETTPLL